MRVRIGEHDLEVKARTARRMLTKTERLRVAVLFRGREVQHPEVAESLLDRFAGMLADCSRVVAEPQLRGRIMAMDLVPKDTGGAIAQTVAA